MSIEVKEAAVVWRDARRPFVSNYIVCKSTNMGDHDAHQSSVQETEEP